MWRLFSANGLYAPPYNQSTPMRSDKILPLDKVEVAARADLKTIGQWATELSFKPALKPLNILRYDGRDTEESFDLEQQVVLAIAPRGSGMSTLLIFRAGVC